VAAFGCMDGKNKTPPAGFNWRPIAGFPRSAPHLGARLLQIGAARVAHGSAAAAVAAAAASIDHLEQVAGFGRGEWPHNNAAARQPHDGRPMGAAGPRAIVVALRLLSTGADPQLSQPESVARSARGAINKSPARNCPFPAGRLRWAGVAAD